MGNTLIPGLPIVFGKIFSKKESPLTGAPPVRRLKTYSALSGYVYQYYYEGHRPSSAPGEQGTEYVFNICSDRKTWRLSHVYLSDSAVATWQAGHGRELSTTERYAVAKMALFQAFDERENPTLMNEDVRVRNSDVEAIVETLGL